MEFCDELANRRMAALRLMLSDASQPIDAERLVRTLYGVVQAIAWDQRNRKVNDWARVVVDIGDMDDAFILATAIKRVPAHWTWMRDRRSSEFAFVYGGE